MRQEREASRGVVSDYAPFVFGSVMLVAAFAFAGHYMGRTAVAHNAVASEAPTLVAPTTMILTKGSLLPDGENFDIVNLKVLRPQVVLADGKGDMLDGEPASTKPKAKTKLVTIEPASVNLQGEEIPPAVQRMALTPSPAKIEKAFKLKRADKQKVVAQRRVRLAEENCLARAVYFEARSESELGQLAVARVILNRVKSPEYPKTICGVVYQGTNRRNSCQFSFACDGLPDDVKQPAAWANAKRIAQKALAGAGMTPAMNNATNYHADYVRPRWAKNMRKLIKIGTHIFYADS